MLRLALALLLSSTPFVELELPALDACAAPDATRSNSEGGGRVPQDASSIACIPLAPTDSAVRLVTRDAARFVVEDDAGRALLAGPVAGDGVVVLPSGAARVVVYAAHA